MILLEKTPRKEFIALLAAASVDALIRSATDSAWERSNLLFKKALLVNSPGSAKIAPKDKQAFKIKFRTITPPWP